MNLMPAISATLDSERTDLLAALAEARTALIRTVRGLTDEQAAERPTVSELCLGGLVKHVALGEERWLRFVLEGRAVHNYDLPDGVSWTDIMSGTAREIPKWMIDYQNGFRIQPGDTLAGIIEGYERIAARTEEIVAAVPDLSATQPLPQAPWAESDKEWSVRRVLIHVIAETTQHAGHAEILRETLDGQTN
jgi:hypothetical protein